MLSQGSAIENSPFHADRQAAKAAGRPVSDMPDADPAELAELLWAMHATKRPEATYPEDLFNR
jgi:hypothetical protein